MGATLATPLKTYANGDKIDLVEFRAQLETTSTADRLSARDALNAAIRRAATINDLETLKCLVAKFSPGESFKVLKGNNEGESNALHLAAFQDDTKIVSFLLSLAGNKKRELIMLQDQEGTPLHTAVKAHNVNTLEFILTALAEDQRCKVLEVQNYFDKTVLHAAVDKGSVDVVELIVKSVSISCFFSLCKNVAGEPILYAAVRTNNVEMVQAILSPLPENERCMLLVEKSFSGETALHKAASEGYADVIKRILDLVPQYRCYMLRETNDQLGKKKGTCLHVAMIYNHPEMIKVMLLPLTEYERYKVLKETHPSPPTVIHFAARQGHTEFIRWCLLRVPKKKFDLLKLADESGNTPLHVAALYQKTDTVSCMLQCVTSDVLDELLDIKNKKSQTIADLAAPQLWHLNVKGLKSAEQEVARLNLRYAQQEQTISLQTNGLKSAEQEVARLKESYAQHEKTLSGQTEALAKVDEKAATNKLIIQELEIRNAEVKEENKAQTEELVKQDEEIRLLKAVCQQQGRELKSAKQEVTTLRGSYVQQEAVIAGQAEELNRLRDNQTEMLRMMSDLQISLGMCFSTGDTPDQENETYKDD